MAFAIVQHGGTDDEIALALFLAAPGRNKLLLAARWGLALLAVAAVITDTPTSYQSVTPLPPNYKAPATLRAATVTPPAFMYRRST